MARKYKNCMRCRSGFLVVGMVMMVLSLGTSGAIGAKIVLVTGFEPFGTYPTNPSQVIVEALNGSSLYNAEIVGLVLPVNFTTSVERAVDALELYHPDVVISLGLNAKADGIEVEKIGVNLKRYPLGDGRWSFPRLIEKNGSFLRFTSFKTNDIVRKIQGADIPAKQSFFAGTYICNALFYGLLGYVKAKNLNTSIGFIHVPLLDTQAPQGMPFEVMVDAVKMAIQVSLGEGCVVSPQVNDE
jgi:pyroglutamyl-peptidase